MTTGPHAVASGRPVTVADGRQFRHLDREASRLDYAERILALAEDPAVSVLERARFLALAADNLDEFFAVRVALLQRRLAAGMTQPVAGGLTPAQQLAGIRAHGADLMQRQAAVFRGQLLPALAEAGIAILPWEGLGPDEQAVLHALFRTRIYPVLSPLAVDAAHASSLTSLSLNLAVVVRDPATGSRRLARVTVPDSVPRFLPVAGTSRLTPVESVVRAHLPQLFPGMELPAATAFRVTRSESLELDELDERDGETLLDAMERELSRRRPGPPVRLEVELPAGAPLLPALAGEIGVGEDQVVALPGPLRLSGLHAIAALDRPELHYPAFVPATPAPLAAAKRDPAAFFSALRERDVLVHHPYDSFASSAQALVEFAAADPHVLAIKQTLYRTSGDSPVVESLIDAAESGKQVLVLVEITARSEEAANVRWARALEQAGCHVVYGLMGLKTHCKLCLVVREEPGGLRRYAHVGTGNYDYRTARRYEDLGLLTADEEACSDLTALFNQLSGFSRDRSYRRLLVAPHSLRAGLVDRIERTAAAARSGQPARIVMKVNSLVDEVVIDALYRAGGAGVPIDLVVRSICALRPQVPGLSGSISVRSIVGRFLEHSRVFLFTSGERTEIWIGSADVMHRNLDRRVEVLLDVRDADARRRLTQILDLAVDPQVGAWRLGPDGRWTRPAEPHLDYQEELLQRSAGGGRPAETAASPGGTGSMRGTR